MNIASLKIEKIAHDDPRYPETPSRKGPSLPFTDVYLCSAITDDGHQAECAHFVTGGDMSVSEICMMLRAMTAAIERMGREGIAA